MLVEQHKVKLGAAAAVAGDAFLGARPRPASKPLSVGVVLQNFGSFFAGLWRHKALVGCIVLAVLVLFILRSCTLPFDLGASKEDLRLRAEIATSNAEAAEFRRQRDLAIAEAEREAALRRAQIEVLSAQGHREIAEATPEHESPIDPELSAAWRRSIERLRDNTGADLVSGNSG